MSVNINRLLPGADYIRSLYGSPGLNPAAALPAGDKKETAPWQDRDYLAISREARALQRSSSAVVSTMESSIGQQEALYRPGRNETTEIPGSRPESAGRVDKPEARKQPGLNVNSLEPEYPQNPAAFQENAATAGVSTAAAEPPNSPLARLEEISRPAAMVDDITTGQANIANFNRSPALQAYAAAANLTQASLIVNYKV